VIMLLLEGENNVTCLIQGWRLGGLPEIRGRIRPQFFNRHSPSTSSSFKWKLPRKLFLDAQVEGIQLGA
jgi:hypothetical protein